MKALGLIVEYNPFHNGHLHHLTQSRALAQGDIVIAVMSGQFTQRGEPAVVDKWRRAQMALDMGVDLVVELPYAYAAQQAEIFARGAVSILTHLKAEFLIFGSEIGDISKLWELEALTSEKSFQEDVKIYLNRGYSLPRAQAAALQQKGHLGEMSQKPNNTLGLHYLRAIRKQMSPLTPLTIPRLYSDYSETSPRHGHITSATAIRCLLGQNLPVEAYLPNPVQKRLFQMGTVPNWEPYFACLRQKILTLGPAGLKTIHDMKEGLEHRFYQGAMAAESFEGLLENVKSKRYTRTRLQRICAHILTHTTAEFIQGLDLGRPVPYVRLLGMSPAGRSYLKHIKKQVAVPIYSKFSTDCPMLAHEQKVTAAYGAAYPQDIWTKLNKDEYARFPIIKE